MFPIVPNYCALFADTMSFFAGICWLRGESTRKNSDISRFYSRLRGKHVYDKSVVTIFTLVASHKTVDLNTVALLANGASVALKNVSAQRVRGSVVLSTCNRLEIYGELAVSPGATSQQIQLILEETSQEIYRGIADQSSLAYELVASSFEVFTQHGAVKHLFTVAVGLESAVVGEREITGQVRRAIATAREEGTATGNLVRLFDRAARTAREVGQQTLLGSQGRSVVSVALDLAYELSELAWDARRALIIGTGAYAGATVAALRERGCQNISVYSSSGRAATFADKRSIRAVPEGALHEALKEADILIGCSGSAAPLSADEVPAGKRIILDLALSRDFAPDVADMPDVELITLETVRLAAPNETQDSIELAHAIVDNEAAHFAVQEKARNVDAAIVALREHTMSILDNELQKVRNQYGCGAAVDQLELTMRRMVKSLLHTPTVRARSLAKDGREADYVAALEALYGIEVNTAEPSHLQMEQKHKDAS